jgi:hypothetical protein
MSRFSMCFSGRGFGVFGINGGGGKGEGVRLERVVIVERRIGGWSSLEAGVEARALVGDDAASRVEGLWGRCVLAGYYYFSR